MDIHHLRTLYQEKASMFLLSCNSNTTCTAAHMNHIESAKSLILNSVYNHYPNIPATPNHRTCVVSSTDNNVLKKRSNNLKAGVITISSDDTKEKEFKILEQKFQELRKCRSDNTSIEYKAKICSDFLMMDDQNSLESQRKQVRVEFYCIACGLPYFNNFSDNLSSSKIRLKSLKRGRTRRRRASRYTAAKFTFDHDILQKHRGGGKSFSKVFPISSTNISHGLAVASVMDARVELKNMQAMRRINDGISKQCISYKCSCGNEQSYKGLRPKRCIRDDHIDKKGDRNSSTKLDNITSKRKHSEKSYTGTNNIDVGSNEDFISLTPVVTSTAPAASNKNLLLSSGGKKRRSKTKQGNKSKLQDFLSSLND